MGNLLCRLQHSESYCIAQKEAKKKQASSSKPLKKTSNKLNTVAKKLNNAVKTSNTDQINKLTQNRHNLEAHYENTILNQKKSQLRQNRDRIEKKKVVFKGRQKEQLKQLNQEINSLEKQSTTKETTAFNINREQKEELRKKKTLLVDSLSNIKINCNTTHFNRNTEDQIDDYIKKIGQIKTIPNFTEKYQIRTLKDFKNFDFNTLNIEQTKKQKKQLSKKKEDLIKKLSNFNIKCNISQISNNQTNINKLIHKTEELKIYNKLLQNYEKKFYKTPNKHYEYPQTLTAFKNFDVKSKIANLTEEHTKNLNENTTQFKQIENNIKKNNTNLNQLISTLNKTKLNSKADTKQITNLTEQRSKLINQYLSEYDTVKSKNNGYIIQHFATQLLNFIKKYDSEIEKLERGKQSGIKTELIQNFKDKKMELIKKCINTIFDNIYDNYENFLHTTCDELLSKIKKYKKDVLSDIKTSIITECQTLYHTNGNTYRNLNNIEQKLQNKQNEKNKKNKNNHLELLNITQKILANKNKAEKQLKKKQTKLPKIGKRSKSMVGGNFDPNSILEYENKISENLDDIINKIENECNLENNQENSNFKLIYDKLNDIKEKLKLFKQKMNDTFQLIINFYETTNNFIIDELDEEIKQTNISKVDFIYNQLIHYKEQITTIFKPLIQDINDLQSSLKPEELLNIYFNIFKKE